MLILHISNSHSILIQILVTTLKWNHDKTEIRPYNFGLHSSQVRSNEKISQWLTFKYAAASWTVRFLWTELPHSCFPGKIKFILIIHITTLCKIKSPKHNPMVDVTYTSRSGQIILLKKKSIRMKYQKRLSQLIIRRNNINTTSCDDQKAYINSYTEIGKKVV